MSAPRLTAIALAAAALAAAGCGGDEPTSAHPRAEPPGMPMQQVFGSLGTDDP